MHIAKKLINNVSNSEILFKSDTKSLTLGKNLNEIIEQAKSIATVEDIYKPDNSYSSTSSKLRLLFPIIIIVSTFVALKSPMGTPILSLISRVFCRT